MNGLALYISPDPAVIGGIRDSYGNLNPVIGDQRVSFGWRNMLFNLDTHTTNMSKKEDNGTYQYYKRGTKCNKSENEYSWS
jgi:hypothetical protein